MYPKIKYPQIIHFNMVFHFKPSILGCPYFWKHPYMPTPIPCRPAGDHLTAWLAAHGHRLASCGGFHERNIHLLIYHKNQPNLGKYTIHGSCGWWFCWKTKMCWKEIQIRNKKKITSHEELVRWKQHTGIPIKICHFLIPTRWAPTSYKWSYGAPINGRK